MTLPLALDLQTLPAAVAGGGQPLLKRLSLLAAERIPGLSVYAPEPDAAVSAAAGGRLVTRLPSEAEIASLRILFVAGLPDAVSAGLAGLARNHRVLVNVEDAPLFCDFHVPAILRRGDLAVSVSTGGKSPTLARRIRTYLEAFLPEIWEERAARLAQLRNDLRGEGAGPGAVMDATDALIDREGWLPPRSLPSGPMPLRGGAA